MTNHLIPLYDRQGRCTYVNAHCIESVRYVPQEGKVLIHQSGKPAYYLCHNRDEFQELLEIINSYLSYQQPLVSKMNHDGN